MIAEIVAASAGTAIASALWKTPPRLQRGAGLAALLLLGALAALGVTGWQLHRARFPAASAATTVDTAAVRFHSTVGHLSTSALALAAPFLVAAALSRRGQLWRKVVHLFVAIFIVSAWLLVGFTGYLLPQNLNHLPPDQVAATVLRFAVLHMFGIPVLLTFSLLIATWRHFQAARRASVF